MCLQCRPASSDMYAAIASIKDCEFAECNTTSIQMMAISLTGCDGDDVRDLAKYTLRRFLDWYELNRPDGYFVCLEHMYSQSTIRELIQRDWPQVNTPEEGGTIIYPFLELRQELQKASREQKKRMGQMITFLLGMITSICLIYIFI